MLPIKIELPPKFLTEEKRSDFIVTEDTKKVWAVELDLLKKVLDVCAKHGLKVWAFAGTMMGAMRHGGFIPWDDDIDLMMLRDDYEALLSIAKDEFEYPYFFQTEYSEKGTLRGHAQVRNSLTSGFLRNDLQVRRSFNQGIFIDIFVLDHVPDEPKERDRFLSRAGKIRKKYWRNYFLTDGYIPSPNPLKRVIKASLRALTKPHYHEEFARFDQYARSYNSFLTHEIAPITFVPDCYPKWCLKREWLNGDALLADFEFLKIPVIPYYDEALTRLYGDWRTPKRASNMHGGIIFDPEKPYLEILKEALRDAD